MSTLDILDIALRGATAGLCLMTAAALFGTRAAAWSARLGALFLLCIGASALLGAAEITRALGPAAAPLQILEAAAPLFFWWFALALFDDEFRWRHVLFAPAAAAIVLFALGRVGGPEWLAPAAGMAWRVIILGLIAHAVVLALAGLRDDLVVFRLRFRIALVFVASVSAAVMVVTELAAISHGLPAAITYVQGAALFALAFGFTHWTLRVRRRVFGSPQAPAALKLISGKDLHDLSDRALLARLRQAMADGAYRERGLTVSRLAARLNEPEPRLRKFLNLTLGHRSFTAFLNERRVAEAERILADPDHARRDVVQVARDVGYASFAPFKRAFKEANGVSPAVFRRTAHEKQRGHALVERE